MSRCCLALEGLSIDAADVAAAAAVAARGACDAVAIAAADECATIAVASSVRPPHFSSSPTKPRSRSSGTKKLCRPTIVGVRIPDRNMPVSLPSRAQSRWWGTARIPLPRPRFCSCPPTCSSSPTVPTAATCSPLPPSQCSAWHAVSQYLKESQRRRSGEGTGGGRIVGGEMYVCGGCERNSVKHTKHVCIRM